MIEPIGEDNLHDYLTALADCELDAESALAVWNYLADHPKTVLWLREQHQLTIAARRATRESAPEDLARKIAALSRTAAKGSNDPEPGRPQALPITRRPAGRWAAVAAGLLIGILGTWYWSRPSSPHASAVPLAVVVHASRVHADCSRLAEGLHAAKFEDSAAELAAAVRADLQAAEPYPDLSSLGFRYVGAGPCGAPLEGTIHLLYRTTRAGSVAAVSLFVQPNRGHYAMDSSHLYAVSSPASPFPMLAWQTDRVVYFLLTDDESTQKAVQRCCAPTTQAM